MTQVAQQPAQPAATVATAASLLERYSAASLQQMARHRGINPAGKNKAELVRLLARDLFDPQRIGAALAGLQPNERALLDRLLLMGGEAPAEALRRHLEREGLVARRSKPDAYSGLSGYGQSKGSMRTRGASFEDLVMWLGLAGLVFTDTSGYATAVDVTQPGLHLRIPEGVRRRLPAVTLPVETTAEPPAVRAADPDALLFDSYVLLSEAEGPGIPVTARGQITKRSLVHLDGLFRAPEGAAAARSEDDLGRLPFLRALLEQLGQLAPRLGALAAGEGVAAFLAQPPGERLAQLYHIYSATQEWCELFRVPGLSINSKGSGRRAPEPLVKARQRVLAELAELPVGVWIPVDHLVERLASRAYEFLLPRSWQQASYSYSYYGGEYRFNPYSGNNALGWTFNGIVDEARGWDQVEGGIIREMVAEPLHWLGLVDVGLAATAKPSQAPGAGAPTASLAPAAKAFRITPDGMALLRGAVPARPVPAPHVVVQPNFQVFVFPPTGEDVLYALDRFAERVRAEQVVEYRLTRDAVYRAQRQGGSVGDVAAMIALLERVSGTPLPQNVRRTLEEWGAQLDRIVIRRGAAAGGLLQALDAATLDQLAADPAAAALLGARLAPALYRVAPEQLPPLYRMLIERGLLPALSEGANEDHTLLLTIEDSGAIRFRHRLPSVFLRHALRAFADERPDGSLALTPASLQRAARAGLDADAVLRQIARWHVGPVSETVVALVRRWARDWGRGALVQAALLQVENEQALRDLLADPEVGLHLQPLPGAGTMALVQPAAVDQVRANLEARGMALGDNLLT